MAPHSVDRMLLLLALVGCLVISIIALIPVIYPRDAPGSAVSPAMKKLDPSKKNYNIQCWTPETFTSTQSSYVDSFCKDQFKSLIKNKTATAMAAAAANPEMLMAKQKAMVGMKATMMQKLKAKVRETKEKVMAQYKLFVFLVLEVAAACLVYIIAQVIVSQAEVRGRLALTCSGHTTAQDTVEQEEGLVKSANSTSPKLGQLANTKGLALSYFTLHLSAAVICLAAAVLCHAACRSKEPDLEAMLAAMMGGGKATGSNKMAAIRGASQAMPLTGQFPCDFSITHSGSSQMYTVQCHYTALREGDGKGKEGKGSATPSSPLPGLAMIAVYANLVLLILYSIVCFIHLVNVFFIAPCAHYSCVAALLAEHGIKAPKGIAYTFSNLSLVALFSRMDIKETGIIPEKQDAGMAPLTVKDPVPNDEKV